MGTEFNADAVVEPNLDLGSLFEESGSVIENLGTVIHLDADEQEVADTFDLRNHFSTILEQLIDVGEQADLIFMSEPVSDPLIKKDGVGPGPFMSAIYPVIEQVFKAANERNIELDPIRFPDGQWRNTV